MQFTLRVDVKKTNNENQEQKLRPPNGQYLGNRQVWHTERQTDIRRKKLNLNLGFPDKKAKNFWGSPNFYWFL